MLRKLMIAGVAVAAIAMAAAPTNASARPWGHGWHGGGWHGGWHRGWGGPRFGFYPGYGAYGYGGYGCWRPVRVFTPYGPRWRRTWVCG
jgi:hypothetical protein